MALRYNDNMQKMPFETKEIPVAKNNITSDFPHDESWVEKRWIIVDPDTGKVLDDAQGYGYKTKQNAIKAGWYRFGGGKQKVDSIKHESSSFWRQNKDFSKKCSKLSEDWFKEIARGEVDWEEECEKLATEMGVVGFQRKFLENL